MQVEHEADQRPLQPRARAHVDRKPRSAQLGRAFQVENAKRFADLPVRLGLEIEVSLLAPGLDSDIVGLAGSRGNFIARQVGNAGQRLAQLLVEFRSRPVQLVHLVF